MDKKIIKNDKLIALSHGYIYTLPLALVNATMEKATNVVEMTEKSAPVNQLFHLRTLATPDSKLVVTPNVDTLYSQAYLDLSKKDAIILEKPFSDRYYMIQVMNAYTDTIATLGTGENKEDEEYGQEKNTYLFTKEDYTGEIPKNVQHIKSTTDLVWIVIRIVINGNEDLKNVHQLQDATRLLPLSNYLSNTDYVPDKGTYDPNKDFVPVDHVLNMGPEEYFNTVNALMVNNPPREEESEIMALLKTVNVGPGMKFDMSLLKENPQYTWEEIRSSTINMAAQTTNNFNITNGNWSYFDSPIGNFGTEYEYRSIVALKGLGANPVEACIYAKVNTALDGDNRYKIHFEPDELPQVAKYGFWSITVYGEDHFLIPNDNNIYAITDRSNFKKNDDGSVDFYVSQELPQHTTQANWLPSISGELYVCMRIYLPKPNVCNGDWHTPTVDILQYVPINGYR